MPEKYPDEITLAGLQTALPHPDWTSYLYVGRASERGWKEARFLEFLMPAYRAYLIPESKRGDLALLGLPTNAKGVVVGPGGAPVKTLSSAKARDMIAVANAIAEVRGQGAIV